MTSGLGIQELASQHHNVIFPNVGVFGYIYLKICACDLRFGEALMFYVAEVDSYAVVPGLRKSNDMTKQ